MQIMHASIICVTFPPGITMGICHFLFTWQSIRFPPGHRKRISNPTPSHGENTHNKIEFCPISKPDVLSRTYTVHFSGDFNGQRMLPV